MDIWTEENYRKKKLLKTEECDSSYNILERVGEFKPFSLTVHKSLSFNKTELF